MFRLRSGKQRNRQTLFKRRVQDANACLVPFLFSTSFCENRYQIMEASEDLEAPSMEERIMAKELYERLHHAVEALPKAECKLIRAVYFEGMTEKE